jgi:hypothetical protein
MATDKKLHKYEIPLDGKLITSQPPAKIGPNFQQLTNMRYTEKGIEGVGGMAKVNTSIMDATYLKTRSGIHFKKDQPSESHVVVEAYNTGETESRILQNTTAIPSQGNFSATSLYSPSTSASAGDGRFSPAPDGDLAYCNGEESIIWGGAEREIAGFINYDPNGAFSYDYTEEMRNLKTDSANKATLTAGDSGGNDANTLLLLHLDNNVDDSSSGGTTHTFTNNNVTFDTDIGITGSSHRGVFTTNAYLNESDHADFDLGNGAFTIDLRLELDDNDSDYSIYYQNTVNDDDSFNILIDTNAAIVVRIKAGGTKAFSGGTDFKTANGFFPFGSEYHLEIAHTGDDWYIFQNGVLRAYTSDAAEPADYTGDVQIGYDGTTYLEGQIDEFRISNICRHTEGYEGGGPSAEYTTGTPSDFYVASVRPLDGIKLYSETANTSASGMTGYYWDGSGYTQVSNLSDETSDSGKSLAKTGTVTFTSTASTAKLKYFEGIYAYWYKFSISAVSAGTALYHATVSTPFQPIKDIWDGVPIPIDSFQKYGTYYKDGTMHVREEEYDNLNSGTFVSVEGQTSSQWFICGFSEKMSGVNFYMASGLENEAAGTVMSVDYWSGSAWTTVGDIDDGTLSGTISLGKNGTVTWDPPTTEHRQTINPVSTLSSTQYLTTRARKKKDRIKYNNRFTQTVNNDVRLYYYRFKFDTTLANGSGDVTLYHITGIPAQRDLSFYKFPFMANDRLWLCCDEKGEKNSVVCSAEGSSAVFNGEDSLRFEFGNVEDIMGAAWLFTSVGSNVYNVMIFFKQSETWALIGGSPEDWSGGKYRISSTIGCVAPHTIKTIDLGPESIKGLNRNIVVWQANDGIYLSDGRSPIKISGDIDDKFDLRNSSGINSDEIANSIAGWDSYNKCYHWCWASGSNTDLDQEWVFDFKKMGWFQILRSAGAGLTDLQYIIEVKDTNGVEYNYGFLNTGYAERLEYNNNFDATDIVHTFHTGDMALVDGSVSTETNVEYICLQNVTKSNTSNSITLTHYGDGSTGAGDSWTESPLKTGYDITMPVQHEKLGGHIFHSLKATLTTDDETVGFEPLYLYFLYSKVRDHVTDWR